MACSYKELAMKTLFLISLLFSPFYASAFVCVPNVDSCGFYACQEKRFNCGPRGYPLGFGFKFCQIFLNTEDSYSPEAHAWLRRVRVCLMEAFVEANDHAEEGTVRTCKVIKTDGFDSHLGCYVKTGFCDLSTWDQFKISWQMRNSFIHPEVVADGLSVLKACASLKTIRSPEAPNEQR